MAAEIRRPVYLDHQATTPVDPRVFEVMRPYFTEKFGNAASSSHSYGWIAEEAVDHARQQVATLIGAIPSEIIWSSGATEANNLAIKGLAAGSERKHLITVATEHKAVLDVMKRLERDGFLVTVLPVDGQGLIDPAAIEAAITDQTLLVSVMAANNEIGVLQPLAEIGALCKAKKVFFHSDAAQAIGKIPINVDASQVDLLSISGHKLYGPKGVGALYVRRKNPRVTLQPLIDGGGHERGLRSGTLDVPAIVGLGAAVELAAKEMAAEAARLEKLRKMLLAGLRAELSFIQVNGDEERRLPGNLSVAFRYVEGEALITAMKDIAVSSGSACTSALREPSHVIRALGGDEERAHSSIRFGLGRFTTEEEIQFTIRTVVEKVKKLRAISPLYEAAEDHP